MATIASHDFTKVAGEVSFEDAFDEAMAEASRMNLAGVQSAATQSVAGQTITGTDGDDVLTGTAGNDVLQGLAGDDVLEGGAGADTLDGGTGNNTASYAHSTSGVGASLAQPSTNGGDAAGDSYVNIENLTGTNFNDTLSGDNGDNILNGGAGNDILSGDNGDDILIGGAGADQLRGGNGHTTASYVTATSGVTASLGNVSINTGDAAGDRYSHVQNLTGSNFNDTLIGDIDDSVLIGNAGDDTLNGNAGNDTLIGGAGADTLIGGTGSDTASYATASTGVTVSLVDPSINTGDAAGDTFSSIENLTGGAFDDTLTGDANDNILTGGAGNDVLAGGAGNDVLEGGAGADTLVGGVGNDTASYATSAQGVVASLTQPSINMGDAAGDSYSSIENLTGTDFDDTLAGDGNSNILDGGDGDDTLIGGGGGDTLIGGDGNNTASYATATAGVSASLADPSTNTGDAAGDSYSSIESLTGSAFNDTLIGDDNDNVLNGGAGDDTLIGGAGGDEFIGGAGKDTVSYITSTTGVTVNLEEPYENTGDAYCDTYCSIEGVTGTGMNDTLTGDCNDNTLNGDNGDDTLNGGGGNDTLIGCDGGDMLNGGEGNDTVSYITSTEGVGANLGDTSGNTGDAAGDTYVSIENLSGSLFNDTLTGDGNNNTLNGDVGNDILNGGAGDDTLIGCDDGDVLNGGDGNDTASYITSTEGVTANLGNSSLNTGDAAGDTYNSIENLSGSNFNDSLCGDGGNNTLSGGSGDDVLEGCGGGDTLVGGGGNDTASYSTSTVGVTANLTSSSSNTGDAAGDIYVDIANLAGSNFNDTLCGDGGNNTLSGGGGDDVLEGCGGGDTLIGGDGNDTATYGSSTGGVTACLDDSSVNTGDAAGDTYNSIENLTGSLFNDTLIGDGNNNTLDGDLGNDILLGGAGNDILIGCDDGDVLNGGDGSDTASYVTSTEGVTASLGNPSINTGDAAGDTYISIENLTGSAYSDILIGDTGANIIDGGAGDDVLIGGGGADTFVGGGGNDTVSYANASAGVTASLGNSSVNTGGAAGNTYSGIANLTGSAFDDTLIGDSGHNVLDGGAGNDTLDCGSGDDILTGGAGNDTFVLHAGCGHVTITDFAPGQDTLELHGLFDNGAEVLAAATQSGTDVIITIDGNTSIILHGVTLGDLHAGDFSFPDSVISGGDGDDTLIGDEHDNVLDGKGGNDTLIGNAGADTLIGGTGNDTASYVTATSGVIASLANSTVNTGDAAGDTYNSVENLTGSALDDTLTGDGGNNTLTGGAGNDTLDGGAGGDTMIGGTGDDTYFVDSSSDVVVEKANEGNDTVIVGINSYTLSANVENAQAALAVDTTLIGNDSDNILTGSAGNDILDGEGGNDTLIGNDGNDILIGGTGADKLIGGSGSDTASYETSLSGVTVSLADPSMNTGDAAGDTYDSVENLIGSGGDDALYGDDGDNTLSGGGGNDMIVGGGGNNTLSGGDGDDTLIGGSGNDILDGGAGNDTLAGGDGDDTYYVDGAGDTIVETAGGGNDTVIILGGGSYTLGDNIENVQVGSGSGGGSGTSITLTGNGGSNNLTGGTGDDVLIGGGGGDSLTGGGGNDTASYENSSTGVTASLGDSSVNTGDAAGDTYINIGNLRGGSFDDILIGDAHDNVLDGRNGNDLLIGNAGADTLIGGSGNDTASYQTAATGVIASLANSSINTGDAAGDTYSSVENLIGSSFDDTLIGDNGDNTLTGGAGNDILDGGAGNDTLIGGLGDDTYFVDSANDTIVENANQGTDTVIVGTTSYALSANVENAQAALAADTTLTGNASDNVLTGNTGNDTLVGGAGADTLFGGDGSDTASYATSTIGLTASLMDSSANTGDAAGDTYNSIENLTGSNFDDTLIGDAGNNVLDGGAGNDLLIGGAGADTLIGGTGNDTASYATSGAGVSANLTTGIGSGGDAAGDTYSGIENLIGSGFDDILTGDSGDNVLTGGAGADQLIGGAGNDTASYAASSAGVNANLATGTGSGGDAAGDTYSGIENLTGSAFDDTLTGNDGNNALNGGAGNDRLVGGAGNDTLTGGAGNDTFVVQAGNGQTTISDFAPGQDIIELHGPFTSGADVLAVAVQSGADVIIPIDASTSLVLHNVTLGNLHAGDFNVIPTNQPPVANADHLTTNEDTPLVISTSALTANDTDPNHDTLTVTSVGNATHGTVSLVNGVVTFTPVGNFSGIAQFDYTISDGHGGTATATATVDVAPVADAPILQVGTGASQKAGAALPVNTSTSGAQQDSAVTGLANGTFVVTWSDASGQGGDASGTSIKAQIFNTAGGKIGGELLVNSSVQNNQVTPWITALANGGFVVAWDDGSGQNGDSSPDSIKAQIYDAAGTKVGGEFLVNSTTTGSQTLPELAALKNGGFLATWTDSSGLGGDAAPTSIKAQIFDAAGNKVGTEFLVNSTTTGSQTNPSITELAGGGFIATWWDFSGLGGDSDNSVKAQMYNASGGTVGGEFLVNTTTINLQGVPRVAALANGGFIVSWQDNSALSGAGGQDSSGASIKGQIYNANGSRVGGEFLINTTTSGHQGGQAITALSHGGFVVTWDDLDLNLDNNSNTVRAQVFDDAGNKVGGELLVSPGVTNDRGRPSVAALATGGFVVTWTTTGGQGGDTSGSSIVAQVYTQASTNEDTALSLNVNAALTDTDGSETLALSASGLPIGTTLTDGVHTFTAVAGATSVNITGWTLANLAVTPPLNFNGDLQLTFTATSTDTATLSTGTASSTATTTQTIDITVTSVNDAPVANADHLNATEDTPLVIAASTLTANDTDADGDTLTLTAVSNATHGTVSLLNGNITFTPVANFSGIAQFNYTVSDGHGGTATATATVDVAPVADAPVLQVSAGGTSASQKTGGEILVNTTTAGNQQDPAIATLSNGNIVVTWEDQSAQGTDNSSSGIKAQILTASGVKVGSEFLVNTTTSGLQDAPSIMALSNGGFVVSWEDASGQGSDNSGFGIKAQMYDATGTKVGGEFLVNTATVGNQTAPMMTALTNGGFVVTWNDLNSAADGSGYAIKAQIYNASGAKVGSEFLVNTITVNFQGIPSIAALTNGGFVVTWNDNSGQAGDSSLDSIRAQIFDASGTKVGGEFLVNTTTSGNQQQPSITALTNGGFVVTWQDDSGQGGDPNPYSIKAQIYTATGVKVGGEMLVNTTTTGSQITPSITALVNGDFVVAWQDGSDLGGDASGTSIKAQVFNAAGAKIGSEFLVNTATLNNQIISEGVLSGGSITALPNGGFAVTWTDGSGQGGDATGTSIKAQMFTFASANEDTALSLNVSAALTDTDGSETLALAASGLPVGTTLTDGVHTFTAVAGATSVNITGWTLANLAVTPPLNFNGDLQLTFTATSTDTATLSTGAASSTATTTQTIDITVIPVNDAPVANADHLNATEDTPLVIAASTLTVNDTDVDGDTLTVTAVGSATHGTVSLVGGNITFTPVANFSGIAQFNYTVSDGHGGTATAIATVDVAPVADAPVLQISAGGPQKTGSEILVNTTTQNNQVTSTIAKLANGGFVIAWDDGSGLGGDGAPDSIKAQMFNAAGGKVGVEFLINTTTAGSQSLPELTALKNGGFLATWTDGSGAGGDTNLKAQIFDANGGKVGSEIPVNTTTTGAQQDSAVSELAGGGFVVTWQDSSGAGGDASPPSIKAQIFDANGAKIGTEFLVNTTTTQGQFSPSIASLQNGGFVIAWHDTSGIGTDASGASVKAQIYTAAGVAVGTEFLVNTTILNNQAHPAITALTNGDFVVTWHDGSGQGGDPDVSIKAQIYTAAGTKVGTEFLVNTTTTGTQQFPSITALANGGFVVTWEDFSDQGADTSGSGIKAQVFDANGVKIGAEFLVNTTTSNNQQISAGNVTSGTSIAGLPNGGFVVTWQDSSGLGGDASGSSIKAQMFTFASTNEDTALSLNVNAALTDTDGSETLALSASGLPIGTTLTDGVHTFTAVAGATSVNITGWTLANLAVTPPLNFNGDLQLTFTATSTDTATLSTGAASSTATTTQTIDITVIPVNDAPVANADHLNATEDTPLVIAASTLTANDTDVDGDTLTVTAVSNATHGTVSLLNGNITFTPAANFSGIAQFNYTVSDGHGGTATATATVDVAPVADAPTLQANPVVGGVRLGNELLVNGNTLSNQQDPSVAALSNGTYVVTWTDSSGSFGDASGTAIVAQIITASGTKVGGEFLVNTTVKNGQNSSSITALKNGGFVVTWEDASGLGGDGTPDSIRAQVFDANGGKVGAELLVNSTTTGNQSVPSITALANGGFVVTWADSSGLDGDGTPNAIKAQVFDANGGKVGGEFLVNTVTAGSQTAPSITALVNGGFVVTWADASGQSGDTDGSVKAQLFDANGGKVGGEFLVNTTTVGFQGAPSTTALSNGNFVVTWQDNNGQGDGSGSSIKAQVFNAAGGKLGGEFLVNTSASGNQLAPSITALNNGGFVVTWQDNGLATNTTVKAQVFNAEGIPAGGEFQINSAFGAEFAPSIAALPNGGIVATWVDNTGGGGDINIKSQVFAVGDGGEHTPVPLNVVAALGSDNDGSEALALSVSNIPVGAILSDGIHTFTATATTTSADITNWTLANLAITPPAGFTGGLQLSFGVTATDTATLSTGTVSSSVTNHAPTVVADHLTTTEDKPLVFSVASLLANDIDVDGDTLGLASFGNASGGTVSLANGNITFTPTVNFSGVAHFDYSVSDGHGGGATATATIDVVPVADTPNLTTKNATGNEDTVLALSVTASLAAADGPETLALGVSGVPVGATLTDGVHSFTATAGNTSVDVSSWALANLTVTPPLNFNGSFQLTVAATSTDTVMLSTGQASDSKTVTQIINVAVAAVNDAPVANADHLNATEDTPLVIAASALTANDTDVDGDMLTVTAVSNATNGTVSLLNGNITFTPAANFSGAAQFNYTVSDGHGGTSTGTVTVTVVPVNHPPVANADHVTTGEDTPLVIAASSLTANDTDVDGDTLTVTAVGNATHGTVSLVGGNITFTPAVNFSGVAQFNYTVSDGNGGTAMATATVDVAPVADAPTVTTHGAAGNEDTAVPLSVSAALADTDGSETLSLAVSGIPAGAVLSDGVHSFTATAGNTSIDVSSWTLANLTVTPPLNFNGDFHLTFSATSTDAATLSSGQASDTKTVTQIIDVAVAPVNDPPVTVADHMTTGEDTPVAIAASSLTANDTDVDGDALTVTAVGNAANGTVSLAGGNITFTPAANFSGIAHFDYTVSDGNGGTAVATVTIDVTPVADAPSLVTQNATGNEDTAVPLNVSAAVTDTDGSETLALGVSGVPVGATLTDGVRTFTATVGNTGVDITGWTLANLTVTPPLNFNGDFHLTFSATSTDTATLSSGQASDTKTVTQIIDVTVAPVNDPPVANADHLNVNEDTPLVIAALTLTANDTDVDGDALTVTTVSNATHGTVSLVGGNITFTPAANFSGIAHFDYTVSDGHGGTATATAIVDVAPVADAPSLVTQTTTGNKNTAVLVSISSALTDTDGSETLNLKISNIPVGATLSDGVHSFMAATGNTSIDVSSWTLANLTVKPPFNFFGNVQLTVTATSTDTATLTTGVATDNKTVTQTVNITVTGVNNAPVAVADHFTINEDAPLVIAASTLTANDTDPDNDTLTVTAVSNATHGTVSLVSGNITFTPVANFSGIAQFNYTVSDGHGGTSTAIATVDVAPVADAPSLILPQQGVVKVGSEILVNTVTSGGQFDPSIIGLSNGNVVVTWTSISVGVIDVKAQILTASGAKLGGEFVVNTTTANSQDSSSITALSNGGFVVTWDDDSGLGGDASGFGIKAQIYNAAGTKVGGEMLVNTTTSGNQQIPSITTLINGGFVVAWQDSSGQGGDISGAGIKAQMFSSSGIKVGDEFLVNSFTNSGQIASSITALSNGGFVVAWDDQSGQGGDTVPDSIKAQIYNAAGAKAGGELLVNTTTAGSQIDPSITALTNGGFVVAWQDSSGQGGDTSATSAKAQIFNSTGTKIGGEFLVNTTTAGNQAAPVLTGLSNGGFVVTWMDQSGQGGDTVPYSIKAQVFNAVGAKVGGELLVNTTTAGSQEAPAITALVNDGFAVTWTDNSTGPSNIKTQAFSFPSANEDTTVPLNVATALTDTDGSETLALTASGLPVGTTLTDGVHTFTAVAGTTSVNITGWALANLAVTPPLNFNGDLQLTFTATSTDTATLSTGAASSTATTTQTIDITVIPVNDAPVAIADHLNTTEDTPLVIAASTLTANDTDVDGDVLTVTAVSNATHGTVSLLNGNITFAPVANFSGVAQFNYTVSDGHGGTATAIATVDVAPVADAPVLIANQIAAVKVGGELLVNTTTAGDQLDQVIAVLPNGNFVVAWGEVPLDAQIFDASGRKIGGEIMVSGTGSFASSITGLANGNIVVVSEISVGPSDTSIVGQIINAAGGKVGGQFMINTTTPSIQERPSITALPNGGFVVTWQDDNVPSDGSGSSIKAQIFNATGSKVGSEFLVNTSTLNSQLAPSIAVLKNGNFVVAWEDTSGQGDTDGIKAQIFDATGNRIGGEFLVNTTTMGNQENPSITALNGGGFAVTWTDDSGLGGDNSGLAIKAQIFNSAGATVGSEVLVNTTILNNQFNTSITGLTNGGFVVTWEDVSNGPALPTIKAQVFDASGVKVGSEFFVNTSTRQSDPVITALANGGFAVSWTDGNVAGDGSGASVKAQVFTVVNTTENNPLPLNISTSLTDTDGSETLALVASSIPAGATLSDGVHTFTAATGATSIDISSWTLANLTVTPPLNFTGDLQLTFSATATDTAVLTTGTATDSKTTTQTNDITVTPTSGLTNDALVSGGAGNDVYTFARGDGQDRIVNGAPGNTAASGELDLAPGITTDQLWFQRGGSDLSISVMGSQDKITVAGWYDSSGSQLQEIKTADGSEIDTQLSQLVQAMASYSAANTGFDPSTTMQAANDSGLQSAIAASWHH